MPSLRSLLRYTAMPRCCRFFASPRREERAYSQRSVTDEQRREAKKQRNPEGESALGCLATLLAPLRSLRTCSSLAPCHPPQSALARRGCVFQQAPNVASSCRSSARHAFHAFLFWRSFEYAAFVRSRSRRRRSFSMAWSSISCNEVLVSSAICARLRCAVRLMRIVDGIQICIRSRIRDCQRNQKTIRAFEEIL